MESAGISPARQTRTGHRHELRTLTYVTIDQGNGGIVRNLNHDGVGVQAVAALRAGQELRMRFELRYPRLRIETRGEVMWSTSSGLCGIRFLDLPPRMIRQINEWIFGNLLEGISLHSESTRAIFGEPAVRGVRDARLEKSLCPEEDDGLLISVAGAHKVIELPGRPEVRAPVLVYEEASEVSMPAPVPLDWLSQPLSGRGLAWTVDTLVVVAGLLLFVLVFLSVTREAPRWPIAMILGAACMVAAMYWGFFEMFGGSSLGARLARLTMGDSEEEEEGDGARFR
jgi:hypothetical protein